MEEQKKSLSEYVRETREKAGFSVQGLSKKSGLTVEQIEDIEAGLIIYFKDNCLNPKQIFELNKTINSKAKIKAKHTIYAKI